MIAGKPGRALGRCAQQRVIRSTKARLRSEDWPPRPFQIQESSCQPEISARELRPVAASDLGHKLVQVGFLWVGQLASENLEHAHSEGIHIRGGRVARIVKDFRRHPEDGPSNLKVKQNATSSFGSAAWPGTTSFARPKSQILMVGPGAMSKLADLRSGGESEGTAVQNVVGVEIVHAHGNVHENRALDLN